MIAEFLSGRSLFEARALIENSGLFFEEDFDELLGIYETGRLIATGARAGNILKMLAIEPSQQGGAVLGELVGSLVQRVRNAGHESSFVYTKPEYVTTFAALNFKLLANQGKVALLEYGNGLETWLAANRNLIVPGSKGAVVMNCNPFTLGHRYLIETAASQVDRLYIFLVREERSVFPFAVRQELLKAGVHDLANVCVLDSSHYIVSGATFPTYFLKRDDPIARIQMELDVTLFGTRIAPFFGIDRRFVGSEPSCPLTGSYNETMQRILPSLGIEVIEIERKQDGEGAISASRVRKSIAANEDGWRALVPETTRMYLSSEAAEPVLKALRMQTAGATP